MQSTAYYSLRPEILVEKCIKMNVSRTKIHLDTSIPPTSISGRREYILVGEMNVD